MSNHIRFKDHDDSGEDYHPTDSDEELSESDQKLLKKVRNKGAKYSDSEEEVFNVYEESEDEDQSDLALSDVEGQDEDDGIPDVKAWGKKKKQYYSTDYVDPDYGGYQGADATLAEIEEEEARNLQQELAKHLDDDDFALDFPLSQVPAEHEHKTLENVIKTDISQLTKRQKLQLLMKESPELFGLIDDYRQRMRRLRDELQPPIKLYKHGKVVKSEAMDFLNSYAQIILNYTVNIIMYLLLKSKKLTLKNHPVIKRLYQYRQFLAQMDPIFEEQIQPQLPTLLDIANKTTANEAKLNSKKKLLSILKTATNEKILNAPKEKHIKFAQKIEEEQEKMEEPSNSEDEETLNAENEEETEIAADGSTKRGINYQIAKNKGLTPHRKKEQRNPRVKLRNKFRKAKIRRKGAVRAVRRETSRYAGEVSGIKASVSKSVKFKS